MKKLCSGALVFLSAFALLGCSGAEDDQKKKGGQQLVIAVPRLEVDVQLSESALKYLQKTYDDEVFVQMNFYFPASHAQASASKMPAYSQALRVGSQLLVNNGRFDSRFRTFADQTMTITVYKALTHFRGMNYDVDIQVWNGSKSGSDNVLRCPRLRTTVKGLQAKKFTLACLLKAG